MPEKHTSTRGIEDGQTKKIPARSSTYQHIGCLLCWRVALSILEFIGALGVYKFVYTHIYIYLSLSLSLYLCYMHLQVHRRPFSTHHVSSRQIKSFDVCQISDRLAAMAQGGAPSILLGHAWPVSASSPPGGCEVFDLPAWPGESCGWCSSFCRQPWAMLVVRSTKKCEERWWLIKDVKQRM